MGVVRFAIELVAIPIILVGLGILTIFAIVYIRQRKKRTKDLEQQSETLPPFVCDQPPPNYSNNHYTAMPMKPPVAMVQEHNHATG
ncbi:hypothetical protein XA68_17510 [Ophiocordyceps unilateralis]|uniref:Uncharacterized protein n=1 Tax=Ophiocordyceps unilateralis TaxID=268505 RepID=A0A2A9P3D6_OPHUN|nr:hypothetical protein XA68_17510 [Ophiocordyceps unilateralis]